MTIIRSRTKYFERTVQEQQNQQITQKNNSHHQSLHSQSSTNTSARGTLANTPITAANGVIINQLLSQKQLISNSLKSAVVKSLPVLNNGGNSYSAMSPQIGKNGQILNPLMSTGGFMKHTVGGPMEVTPRSRTWSLGKIIKN